MFKFFKKLIPVRFVEIENAGIEANRVRKVLEDFSDDDDINDYNLDKTAADILVKQGVLKIEGGSRQAVLYCKTDKFESFYEEFMEQFYDEEAGKEKKAEKKVYDDEDGYGPHLFRYKYGDEDDIVILVGNLKRLWELEKVLDGAYDRSLQILDRLNSDEKIPVMLVKEEYMFEGLDKVKEIVAENTKDKTTFEYFMGIYKIYDDIIEG